MKLHLGCGKRYIPGYVHIDVLDFPHIDLRCQIDRIPHIIGDTIDVIYVCHVLEHFHRRDTHRVLREWHRILKPGGTLRVAVPDFKACVDLYLKLKASGTDDQDLPIDKIIGPIFGRQDYLYNIHYTVFDFDSLRRVLVEAGFLDVRLYDWRKTDHADVDDYSQSYYPHMDKDNGMLLSLNVEARKP